MSNNVLDVTGSSLKRLKTAFELSNFGESEKHPPKIVGYAKDGMRLVLFKHMTENLIPFPCPMSLDLAAEMAHHWVMKGVAFPAEDPDFDGTLEKGWRVYTERWERIEKFGNASHIAIEPYWIEYGK